MAGRLVARSVEWETLWSAVERAAAGQSATVVVAGEAGVGKSRLVEELARTAEDQGIRVLVGRCVDIGDGELPYAPIAGALRGLLAGLSEEEAEAVFGPDRAVLGRLVPELAGTDDGARDPVAAFAKARLFELVLRTVGRLGERAPVLLVVEDLHWADGSTRDLLRFLVRGAARERLALVLTCRTEGLARGHPLAPVSRRARAGPPRHPHHARAVHARRVRRSRGDAAPARGGHAELGAVRIFETHEYTSEWVKAFGLELVPYDTGTRAFHLQGKRFLAPAAGEPWPLAGFADGEQPEPAARFPEYLVSGFAKLGDLFDPGWPGAFPRRSSSTARRSRATCAARAPRTRGSTGSSRRTAASAASTRPPASRWRRSAAASRSRASVAATTVSPTPSPPRSARG